MRTKSPHNEQSDVGGLRRSTRNYLWNFSPKLNVVYLEIPKACCTTIKAALQSVELDIRADELSPSQIHDRKNSPLLNYDELVAKNIDDFKAFTFVRNPYTRIFSAYKDKLVDNQWEKTRRAEGLGFSADQDIGFLDFLHAIQGQPRHMLDIHWLPQSLILENHELDYVGRFEQFDNDYFVIANLLGLPLQLHARKSHSTGTGNTILQSLSREEIEIINDIYRADFISLGYLMME